MGQTVMSDATLTSVSRPVLSDQRHSKMPVGNPGVTKL